MFFREIIEIVSGAIREFSFGESRRFTGELIRFLERLACNSDLVMIRADDGDESVFEFSVILSTLTFKLVLLYRPRFINLLFSWIVV